jgi:hypothetical protein
MPRLGTAPQDLTDKYLASTRGGEHPKKAAQEESERKETRPLIISPDAATC